MGCSLDSAVRGQTCYRGRLLRNHATVDLRTKEGGGGLWLHVVLLLCCGAGNTELINKTLRLFVC